MRDMQPLSMFILAIFAARAAFKHRCPLLSSDPHRAVHWLIDVSFGLKGAQAPVVFFFNCQCIDKLMAGQNWVQGAHPTSSVSKTAANTSGISQTGTQNGWVTERTYILSHFVAHNNNNNRSELKHFRYRLCCSNDISWKYIKKFVCFGQKEKAL